MIYDPPPLWYVSGLQSRIYDSAREVSAGQAALTVAARHGAPGDYFVDRWPSTGRKLFRVWETAKQWKCKELKP